MSMADPETEDWTQITEPRLRKRVQNRLSQRKHRQSLRQQRKGSLEIAPPSSQTPNLRPGNTVPRLAPSSAHLDAEEWSPRRSNIEHTMHNASAPKRMGFDRWDGIDDFGHEVLEAPDVTALSCDASSQISSWPAINNINPQSRRLVDPSPSMMLESGNFLPPPPPPPSPALAQTGPKVLARRVKNTFPVPAPGSTSASTPAAAAAAATTQWSLAEMQEFDSMQRTHPPPLTCNPSTLNTDAMMTPASAAYGIDPRFHSRSRNGVQARPRRPSNHLDNVLQSPLGSPLSPSSPMYLNMPSDAGRRGFEQYESLRLGNGHEMLRI